jgi:predicted metal-binding membrane protein
VNRASGTLESVVQHPRWLLIGILLVIVLPCWVWIILMARDMYGSMLGPAAWMMTPVWDLPHLVLLWAMWAVMMAAMMVPSAAPVILLYSGAVRSRLGERQGTSAVSALTAGYLTVWILFSVAAAIVQRVLASRLLLTPMMQPATPLLAGLVLLLAGVYQLTPLKLACLRACRSPLSIVMSYSTGTSGQPFRLGLAHGGYCLGCCWALMLLLFAGGVMNLFVIGALTAWVAVEKLAPLGQQGARVSGALLIAAGVWAVYAAAA